MDGEEVDSSDSGSRPTTADARQAMLAKQRAIAAAKKKKTGGMISANDHVSRRPMTATGSRPGTASDPSPLVKKVSSSSLAREPSDEAVPHADVKSVSKIEKLLREQGFDDTYEPGTLRFKDEALVAPAAGPGETQVQRLAQAGFEASETASDSMAAFALAPAPEGHVVQCRIFRDRRGMDKGLFPTYVLKLEKREIDGVRLIFLLAGRKRKYNKTSNYIVCSDIEALAREGEGSHEAKLRSNFVGTHFTIFDSGVSPRKADGESEGQGRALRNEIGAVIYETNLLGFKGPRKMTVVIPSVDSSTGKMRVVPDEDGSGESIVKKVKEDRIHDLLVLHNKKPQWNEETGSYVLNFHGRVTQASVKNFQIVHESDLDYVILQFGRVDENEFTMDYQYPMSAVQAFSIALSSFDGKLVCE